MGKLIIKIVKSSTHRSPASGSRSQPCNLLINITIPQTRTRNCYVSCNELISYYYIMSFEISQEFYHTLFLSRWDIKKGAYALPYEE